MKMWHSEPQDPKLLGKCWIRIRINEYGSATLVQSIVV